MMTIEEARRILDAVKNGTASENDKKNVAKAIAVLAGNWANPLTRG